jgi:hypothetical protein
VTKCWDEDEWAREVASYYKPANSAPCCHTLRGPRAEFISPGSTPRCGLAADAGGLESGYRVAREVNAAV